MRNSRRLKTLSTQSTNSNGSAEFRCPSHFTADDFQYPPNLRSSQPVAFPTLYWLGDPSILTRRCVGLICSVTCPGRVIIRTFDVIREIRDAGIVVAGGFHSPMERECLDFLLRGSEPTILCLSRHPHRARLPKPWQTAIDNSRLILLSPFGQATRRTSKATSYQTNLLVANLSEALLVPFATPRGMTDEIVTTCLAGGTKILTFQDAQNLALHQRGASIYAIDALKQLMIQNGG